MIVRVILSTQELPATKEEMNWLRQHIELIEKLSCKYKISAVEFETPEN